MTTRYQRKPRKYIISALLVSVFCCSPPSKQYLFQCIGNSVIDVCNYMSEFHGRISNHKNFQSQWEFMISSPNLFTLSFWQFFISPPSSTTVSLPICTLSSQEFGRISSLSLQAGISTIAVLLWFITHVAKTTLFFFVFINDHFLPRLGCLFTLVSFIIFSTSRVYGRSVWNDTSPHQTWAGIWCYFSISCTGGIYHFIPR